MTGQQDQNRNFISRFFHGVWKLISRVVFAIGLMVIVSTLLIGFTVAKIGERVTASKPLPSRMLLTYTFKDNLVEAPGQPRLDGSLLAKQPMISDFVNALDRASRDTRVVGFAADIENINLNVAQVQEIRQAVIRFRNAGKFAMIYAPNYGGMGSGMGDYYLASAFSEIWMQPIGLVGINGVAVQVPFFKGVFDKVGIEADFVHKGIYKSAPESLTSTGMTAPTRENMTTLVNDLSSQILSDISASRKVDAAALQAQSPFTDKLALQAKLIDNIGYFDEVAEAARAKVDGEKTKGLDLFTYAKKTTPKKPSSESRAEMVAALKKLEGADDAPAATVKKTASKIAVIIGAGEISAGAGSSGFGEGGMTADKIAAAFKAVEKNDDIGAVVFRIDSPGGAPDAAETIRRAVMQVQKKGKPVVVSMGGYAASGGYWVATPADKIVAQPGTVTGSIGVFGGKIVVAGLLEKLGVNIETITSAEGADMWAANRKFTEAEYAKYSALLDNIYDAFLTRVADGRKMTKEQAHGLAEGRVYTGREAKERGLVDMLGGLDVAIGEAKALAGFKPEQDVPVVYYPPKQSPLMMFMQMASGEVSLPSFHITVDDILKAVTQMPRSVETIACCK